MINTIIILYILISNKMYKIIIICFILVLLIAYTYINYYLNSMAVIEDNKNVGNKILQYVYWKQSKNLLTFYQNLYYSVRCWNPLDFNDKNIEEKIEDYSQYWKTNKKEIENVLNYNQIKKDSNFENSAVIHFRCSDSPFIKDPNYTLLPKEFYDFACTKIKEKNNINKIYFMMSTNWGKKDYPVERCTDFVNDIADWLKENLKDHNISIDRNPIDKSIKESYGIMLGAGLLITSVSSFSFIPGVVKGKDYISSSMFGNIKVDYEKYKDLHKKVHWTMWDKFDYVPHPEDYKTFDYKNFKLQ